QIVAEDEDSAGLVRPREPFVVHPLGREHDLHASPPLHTWLRAAAGANLRRQNRQLWKGALRCRNSAERQSAIGRRLLSRGTDLDIRTNLRPSPLRSGRQSPQSSPPGG